MLSVTKLNPKQNFAKLSETYSQSDVWKLAGEASNSTTSGYKG